jgi:hypothetical protein
MELLCRNDKQMLCKSKPLGNHMSTPVISPDGKYMWTGSEWIPAPPQEMIAKPPGINDSVIMGDVVSNIEISTNSLSKAELLYSEAKKNEEKRDFSDAIRLYLLSIGERCANEEKIVAYTKYRIGICYVRTDGWDKMCDYYLENFDELEQHLSKRDIVDIYERLITKNNSPKFEIIYSKLIAIYEDDKSIGKWNETFEGLLRMLVPFPVSLHSNHRLVLEILDHWLTWCPDYKDYFRVISDVFGNLDMVFLDKQKQHNLAAVIAYCHLAISMLKMLERQYPIYRYTFDQTLPDTPLSIPPDDQNWNFFQRFARQLQHKTDITGTPDVMEMDFPSLLFMSMSYYTDILFEHRSEIC